MNIVRSEISLENFQFHDVVLVALLFSTMFSDKL